MKEAHERHKAGSVDVLHCYYAHGEENENFQRRSYWLLEEKRSNIVLVHYREVKVRNLFYYFFLSSLLKKFTIDNLQGSTDTDTGYGYDTIRYGYGDTAKFEKVGY